MDLQTHTFYPSKKYPTLLGIKGGPSVIRCHLFLVRNTQDDDFHFMLYDPRNGNPNIFYTSQETNLQGVSIMYRVINSRKLFEALIEHDFN